ncbi:MAG: polysaccharide deacetylase family protein, partial [Solirubrobacterales bacterium]|nr:polysaccharide deacetylase family protein [Solirubrobacterales bacterium]
MDVERGDHERPNGAVLSPGELSARRAATRRRRTRRRGGLLVGLAIVAAVGVAIGSGASGGRKPAAVPRPPTRVVTRVPSAGLAGSGGSVKRRAAPQASVGRVLAYTTYVQLASSRRREVALTFDDGPSQFTRLILATLVRTHTPATFFVIGRWARAYPQVLAAETSDGFEIGDHTQTHAFLTQLSPARQRVEIEQAAGAITGAGAPAPVLFRPPYGAFNAATLAILRAARLLMVLWSVDTSDYARPGVRRIVYTAVSGARPGAIILMHDGGG